MKFNFYDKEYKASLPKNVQYPAFALVKDGWNDYGHYLLYNLYYYPNKSEIVEIGNTKILEIESSSTTLPKYFNQLESSFCSLGQSLEFYEKIKEQFPETFVQILNALNDIAIDNSIAEQFKSDFGFASGLLRFSAAEKAFNEAKILLLENKKTVNDDLFFHYTTTVEGADAPHKVSFDFINSTKIPFRINVLIGKNGTGKTQFLGSMVNSISGVKYKDGFTPYNPLFRKVIAISYSLFDDFPKPKETTVFSYKYIGLRGKDEEIVSDEKLGEKLKSALMIIIKERRTEIWFYSINKIINLANLGITDSLDLTTGWIEKFSYKEAKRLSSGQSITLFILTELIAHIEDESLILFDEPETHLHPSAIGQLINCFYEILEHYKSFSIISTHSPLIVQDIPSKYISIFDRIGNLPIVRKLPLESFGENISILTSNIFETIEVKELYKKYLDALSDRSIERIESLFENGLSINAQLYLASIQIKNEES